MEENERELRRWVELRQALQHALGAYEEVVQAQARIAAAQEDVLRGQNEVSWALGTAIRIMGEE